MWHDLQLSADEFASAHPDPVAPLSGPIAAHVNDDHGDAMLAIVQHFVPLDTAVSHARLLGLDRLGMEVLCDSAEGQFNCRIPFIRWDMLYAPSAFF